MTRAPFEKPQTLADRIVWFVFGLVVGVPFGLLAWLIGTAFGLDAFIGGWVLASICVAFAIVGSFSGHVLFDALLGVLHLAWGVIAGQADVPEPERGTAHWLKIIFYVGLILGIVTYVAFFLH